VFSVVKNDSFFVTEVVLFGKFGIVFLCFGSSCVFGLYCSGLCARFFQQIKIG
jgi:hypothetical protein